MWKEKKGFVWVLLDLCKEKKDFGMGTGPVLHLGLVGAPFCFKVHSHTQKKKCVVRECVIK